MQPKYFVFDIESIGLFGEGFAFGYVVVTQDGDELGSSYCCCPSDNADGFEEDRTWVNNNVLPNLPPFTRDDAWESPCEWVVPTPESLREVFLSHWLSWKKNQPQIVMVSDCSWPVESNFLTACFRDKPQSRSDAPYPFLDLSGILLAAGLDPTETFPREGREEPAHNPLNDARQSARILIETLGTLRRRDRYRPDEMLPVVQAAQRFAFNTTVIPHWDVDASEDVLRLVSVVEAMQDKTALPEMAEVRKTRDFTLRLPRGLHAGLTAIARHRGISLNTLMNDILSEADLLASPRPPAETGSTRADGPGQSRNAPVDRDPMEKP